MPKTLPIVNKVVFIDQQPRSLIISNQIPSLPLCFQIDSTSVKPSHTSSPNLPITTSRPKPSLSWTINTFSVKTKTTKPSPS
ncbi:hypothetical protein Sjap_017589 [Stephania japonica]|uniref:Uncharacterized protein n=1 Tax=Stephania japonica TaxID=461633 RepID=A0AAP0I6F3_9MAGN